MGAERVTIKPKISQTDLSVLQVLFLCLDLRFFEKWRLIMITALYLRLSKEDRGMADESNSITNQRYILHRFVEQRPEFESYEIREYTDDGFSGKNFERPGVQKLLEDVKSGKVYCIIVKDFSRFGRNHIEVGNYVEKIFPLLDIRFISVNNYFDSKDYTGTVPDIDVAFENLMYDYFSEENSVKIKNDLMGRRMRGNYLATFAAFGYKKSPSGDKHIIIDEEAAAVVRMIFKKYVECGVKAEVARYLNNHGIPTPQVYAVRKGYNYRWKYQKEKKLWNGSIVGRILENELYIGNTVFHKKESVETGSRKTKCLPKEEWKVCEGTHEPIISKELFEFVNNVRNTSKRFNVSHSQQGPFCGEIPGFTQEKCPKCGHSPHKERSDQSIYCEGERRKRGNSDSPVKGLVKCGGCKHNMQRRNRLNVSYYCRYYYEARQKECCPDNVKEKDILEIVLSAIRYQVVLASETERLQKLYKQQYHESINARQREKQKLEEKIQELTDINFSLYESYTGGGISVEQFMQQKESNNALIETYKAELQAYQVKEMPLPDGNAGLPGLLEGKIQHTDLTKKLTRQLVDAIYIYINNRVEVVFKFRDKGVIV